MKAAARPNALDSTIIEEIMVRNRAREAHHGTCFWGKKGGKISTAKAVC